ncbi:hypothetical protein J3R83DRAFT_9177 [Lanmaoa asiatica]|nr:hypothetical protein J3R83DRAFT_9177 [Lanmaoa asiatica]
MSDQPCLSLVCWVTSLPPHSALVAMNAMSSLVSANFSGTNSSACVRSSSFRPNSTYSCFQVRTSGVQYPPPSESFKHPSRSSLDSLEDLNKNSMEPTAEYYRIYRRRERIFRTTMALARDGYRCMITGMFDSDSLLHRTELQAMATRNHVHEATVQTCHILNESTVQLRGGE